MSDKSHPDSDLCTAGTSSMTSNPSSSLKRSNNEAPDHPEWMFSKRPAPEFDLQLEHLPAPEGRSTNSRSIPKAADVMPQPQQAMSELAPLDLRLDADFRLTEFEASTPYIPPNSHLKEDDVGLMIFMNKYHRALDSKAESRTAGTDSDGDNDYLYPSPSKKQ